MILIVNFKTYENGTGAKALALAKICNAVAKKTKSNIAIAVQSVDIAQISKNVSIPVLAQHVDAIDFGAHTGWSLPESIKEAGAIGSLINHSELRVPENLIKQSIARLRTLGLISVVCAANPSEEQSLAMLKPDMLAIEPPELIGGKISVSKAKPEVIYNSVINAHGIPVLCGAGIHSADDVKKALQLGAKGILVASSIVNAKDPRKVLIDLVRNLQ